MALRASQLLIRMMRGLQTVGPSYRIPACLTFMILRSELQRPTGIISVESNGPPGTPSGSFYWRRWHIISKISKENGGSLSTWHSRSGNVCSSENWSPLHCSTTVFTVVIDPDRTSVICSKWQKSTIFKLSQFCWRHDYVRNNWRRTNKTKQTCLQSRTWYHHGLGKQLLVVQRTVVKSSLLSKVPTSCIVCFDDRCEKR